MPVIFVLLFIISVNIPSIVLSVGSSGSIEDEPILINLKVTGSLMYKLLVSVHHNNSFTKKSSLLATICEYVPAFIHICLALGIILPRSVGSWSAVISDPKYSCWSCWSSSISVPKLGSSCSQSLYSLNSLLVKSPESIWFLKAYSICFTFSCKTFIAANKFCTIALLSVNILLSDVSIQIPPLSWGSVFWI